jgi:hypothetical protein
MTPTDIPVAVGATVTLLRLTVPTGLIAVIEGVGQGLELSAAFDDIGWGFKVDGVYVPSVIAWTYNNGAGVFVTGQQYRNMRLLFGPLWDPFRFPVPFVLEASHTFEVEAINNGLVDHAALARIIGYAYPSQEKR